MSIFLISDECNVHKSIITLAVNCKQPDHLKLAGKDYPVSLIHQDTIYRISDNMRKRVWVGNKYMTLYDEFITYRNPLEVLDLISTTQFYPVDDVLDRSYNIIRDRERMLFYNEKSNMYIDDGNYVDVVLGDRVEIYPGIYLTGATIYLPRPRLTHFVNNAKEKYTATIIAFDFNDISLLPGVKYVLDMENLNRLKPAKKT